MILIVASSFLILSAQAAEPKLIDILNYLGFTNVALRSVETFSAGTYNITLYAEFAGYHAGNELSYYQVSTSVFNVIFTGPEGGYEYVVPPITKSFTINYQFGLSMLCGETGYRYFTQQSRNPDGLTHARVYENLDSPGMYLIGFENRYGQGADRDFNDMVFSLKPCPNQAPVASFTYSPAEPRAEQIVTFNASASYDPDGSIVSYQWNFGDGNVTTVTNPTITHVYVNCGNYTVTLTVTDNGGLASSTSQTITVINPTLLRLWADVGSYVGSHSDAWIRESWVVSSDVPAGGSVSFNLYIDAISNPCGADPTYDVYLAVAVNDTAQVASIIVGSTTITAFTYGEVTWPSVAGGGTLSPHGVYPTWYALAPFGDVTSNHGYYTTPSAPYGPYWAFRAYIPVTITTSTTMNAGFKVHFDAQGVLVKGSTKPGHRNSNPFSHDLTFKGSLYIPPVVKYYLTVKTDPEGITTIPGEGWYDNCTYVKLTAPEFVPNATGINGQRYRFANWTVNGETFTTLNITVHMDANHTATAHYITQYYLTVISPYGTPGGAGWYNSSTFAYATLNTGIIDHGNDTRRVFTNWSGDASGTNYAQSNPIQMNGPKTATANWKTQYKFTVRTNGLGTKITNVYNGTTILGTATDATPYTGWFDQNALIQLDIDSPIYGSPTRYVFTQWTGDASGSDRPLSVTMNSPKDITANYKTQYQITVTANPSGALGGTFKVTYTQCGTVYTNVQKTTPWTEWVDAGTTVTVSQPQDIINGPTGTRYKFDHYDPSASVTMDQTKTITLVYKTQYYLTVTSAHDTPIPSSGWFDAGTPITASVTSPADESGGVRYRCTGWTGTGSVPSSGTGTSVSFTINQPSSITWNWIAQYYLTVTSPYDTPTPASGWFDTGTSITASVTSPWAGPPGVRYVCTGWTGTGSVPTSGSTASVTFTINQASSITWNWKTQYYLTVKTDPTGLSPAPTPPSGWYDKSQSVQLTAATVSGYTFDYWDVDGQSQGSGVNPITVPMDNPHTATAHYEVSVPPPPVGGYALPIELDLGTSNSLIPQIGLASTLLAIVAATIILVRRGKKTLKRER